MGVLQGLDKDKEAAPEDQSEQIGTIGTKLILMQPIARIQPQFDEPIGLERRPTHGIAEHNPDLLLIHAGNDVPTPDRIGDGWRELARLAEVPFLANARVG